LFLVYVNDISEVFDDGVKSQFFADDVKMYSVFPRFSANTGNLSQSLQNCYAWSQVWQLTLQPPKCMALHVGYGNLQKEYSVDGEVLVACENVRDLGVMMSRDLNFSVHCSTIAKRAFARSALIFRCFQTKNVSVLLRAFTVYVRPILESSSEVWSPYLLKDINLIESVQRRFTRRLCLLCNIPFQGYKQRLQILKLDTLEHRRKVFDLVLLYKIVHGLVCIKFDDLFEYSLHNPSRIQVKHTRVEVCKNSFVSRVTNQWNWLPSSCINSVGLQNFRNSIRNVTLHCSDTNSSFCSTCFV